MCGGLGVEEAVGGEEICDGDAVDGHAFHEAANDGGAAKVG